MQPPCHPVVGVAPAVVGAGSQLSHDDEKLPLGLSRSRVRLMAAPSFFIYY